MEAIRGTIELGVLAQLLWHRKWTILLGGVVCAALVTVAASGLPVRYFTTGLLIAETAAKSGEPNDRPTQSDILHSPSLLESTDAHLNLAHQPQFIPRFRYSDTLVKPVTYVVELLVGVIRDLVPPISTTPASSVAPVVSSSSKEPVTNYLQQHLTVGGNENSRVLTIGFETGSPELAAAVVNEVMQQYVDRDLANRRDVAEAAYKQLMERVTAIKQEADAADLQVQKFQQQNSVLTLQAGSPAALQLNAQENQLALAKLDVAQAQAAFDASQQGNTRGLSSPVLQSLSDRETDVLQRIARAGDIGPLNPRRLALDDELRTVRAQIDAESRKASASMARDVDITRRRVIELESSVADSKSAASGSGNTQLALTQLARDADSKRNLYQTLLAQAENVRVAAAQMPSAQIVSLAVPPIDPERSRAPMMEVLGFVGGVLLTVTAILLRNLISVKISSAKLLANTTGMPGLGSLPHLRGSRRLSMQDLVIVKGQSPIAETLRGMRLTLQDLSPSGTGSTVLITSAEAREGKTTVAASLARRAAGDGLHVLLVEADLRQPCLSKRLDLGSSATLEMALLGRDDFSTMIQVDSLSGLNCIVARGNHPNPVSLLASERFNAFMAYARKSYDLVIIDSPPVLRVSDPILLSRWADVIVFAVRAEDTAQALVVEALSRFPEQAQSRVLTLLTRAPISRHDRHGYFAGYGNWRKAKDIGSNTVLPPPNRSRPTLPDTAIGSLTQHGSKTR